MNMETMLTNYTMYKTVTSATDELSATEIVLGKFNSTITQYEYNTSILHDEEIREPLTWLWSIIDALLTVVILGGNTLTILAVTLSRKLSNLISNKFVLNLAISDLSVGLTLPYHLAFYLDNDLGKMKTTCVLRFILITFGWCASVLNLIGIAIDRYIAILHPLHYSRYMTNLTTGTMMGVGWMTAVGVSVVPIFWNNWGMADSCDMHKVIPKEYTTTVLAPMFSIIWLLLLVIYWRIWREAAMHTKRMRTTTSLPAHGPNDWKSIQVVLMVLGSFSICWMPYIAVICAQAITTSASNNPTLYKAVFSLAMANAGINPIIYAWKNTGFRKAFLRLLRLKNPDCPEFDRGFRANATHPSSERKLPLETISRRETLDNTNIQETNIQNQQEDRTDTALDSTEAETKENGFVLNNDSDVNKGDRCRIIENVGYDETIIDNVSDCHIIENLGFDDSLDVNSLRMIDSNSKGSDGDSVATLPVSPADTQNFNIFRNNNKYYV